MASIKLCFGEEIRRFPATSAADVESLWKKIGAMYPEIDRFAFIIFWKDKDGDKILISDNDDLQEARRNSENGVLRLTLEQRSARSPQKDEQPILVDMSSPDAEETTTNGTNETTEEKPASVHRHVICDNCDKEIDGARFKCILCRDYDLCRDCEVQQVHHHHPMLRVASPTDQSWKMFFHRATIIPRIVGNEEHLTKVGDMVALFLKHFGVEVDYEIRPPRQDEAAESQNENSTNKVNTTEKENTELDRGSGQQQSAEGQTEPRCHDWEILDSCMNDLTVGSNREPLLAQIYPNPVSNSSYEDTVIDAALAHMQAMGFSNENGLLCEMLRRNNGDISAVLDALQYM